MWLVIYLVCGTIKIITAKSRLQNQLRWPIIVGNKSKGRISKRVFQENKAHQIFRKTNISYPLIRTLTTTYQGVRNVRYSENLASFVFMKHPFWDSPFCLITDVMQCSTRRWFKDLNSLQKWRVNGVIIGFSSHSKKTNKRTKL